MPETLVVALEMSMKHCFRTNNVRYTLPPSIMAKWRGLRGLVKLIVSPHGKGVPLPSVLPQVCCKHPTLSPLVICTNPTCPHDPDAVKAGRKGSPDY